MTNTADDPQAATPVEPDRSSADRIQEPGPAERARMSRLHPATLVLEVPSVLLRWVGPFVLIGWLRSEPETFLGHTFRFAAVGALLGLVAALARFATLRFGLGDGQLRIVRGLVHRTRRTIPLAQIHHIDIKSSALERLLGVAEVRIETAGGIGAEAHLKVVSRTEAEALRAAVSRRPPPAAETAPRDDVVRALGLREVLLAGATENRIGAIVAAFVGLHEILEDTGFDVEAFVAPRLEAVLGRGALSGVLVAAASIAVLAAAGWLTSIAMSLRTWYGFTLRRSGDELRRSHGLLTRYEGVVAVKRVQVLMVESTWLRRKLGLARMRVQTAGTPNDSGGASVLFPLLPLALTERFGRLVYPDLPRRLLRLKRVHPRSLRRGFVRYAAIGAMAACSLAAADGARWLWLLALVPPLAWVLARARYRSLGYRVRGRFLLARAGILTRRTWIVPVAHIQTVSVRQNPFQRRAGLATLVADTAGAAAWSTARVTDLALDDALALLERLSREAARADWGEGV